MGKQRGGEQPFHPPTKTRAKPASSNRSPPRRGTGLWAAPDLVSLLCKRTQPHRPAILCPRQLQRGLFSCLSLFRGPLRVLPASPTPLTCSIICRTLRCWLFSMSSRWWIFSRSMATSFSSWADLREERTSVQQPPDTSWAGSAPPKSGFNQTREEAETSRSRGDRPAQAAGPPAHQDESGR